MSESLKVVVADDTALYRKIISDAVELIPDTEVVSLARDGEDLLTKLKKTQADLVLLDVVMPQLDGLGALERIKKEYPKIPVVMISGANRESTEITFKALNAGALDFIAKPTGGELPKSHEELSRSLERVVKIAKIKSRVSRNSAVTIQPTVIAPKEQKEVPEAPLRRNKIPALSRYDLMVIGSSTGGPKALLNLFTSLELKKSCPIIIVQHMPENFTAPLAKHLSKATTIGVKEASDGEELKDNFIYIAPGGYHMELMKNSMRGKGYILRLNKKPPVHWCRPAVDVTFKSVADNFEGNILSLILTGMGEDGAQGIEAMKAHKCYTISQEKESCTVYGMPKAVEERGLSDEVLTLEQIVKRVKVLINNR